MKKVYLAAASLLIFASVKAQGPVKSQQTVTWGGFQTYQATDKLQTINTNYEGHHCHSHELEEEHYTSMGYDYQQLLEQNQLNIDNALTASAGQKTPGTNTISVIFHVVHNPANPAENVSNALIMQVFNDLVEDFQLLNADAANARSSFGFVPADANINFCLATQTPAGVPLTETGVVRVSTSEDWYDSDNGEENEMKSAGTGGSTIWNRNNYLNVWICDISNGASSGTAGYAYRPVGGVLPGSTIDGIVLDYNLGMNNENVLTHEVGHYLGLDHTWGGSGSCSMDDGFADTPNTAGPSFNYAGSCSGNQSTCSGVQTQYENYMDYSNCTCMFTANQATYMLSILTGIRGSLLLSPGCDPTNTPPNSDFTADLSSPIIIPVNGTVNLLDLSTNVPTAWSWVISGTAGVNWTYVGGTSAASQNPSVTFLTVGTYNVTLTASNVYGADATPATQTAYIQVVAPSSGTACDTLRNYTSATEDLAAYILEFSGFADWGYMPGHSAYDGPPLYNITHYADRYVASSSSQVRRIRIPVLQANDLSGSGFLKVRVHNSTGGTPGVPGAVLTTDTMYIADMTELAWNEFDFTNPATVTGAFWVSFEFIYGAPQDTVILACVDMADRALTTNTNTMKMNVNGTYYRPQDLYGTTWRTSLYMDVLLSNGPSPVADMTYSDTEVCPGGQIIVNGASSTNTTNYYWYQTDEPVTTIISSSTAGGATFNFAGPAGDYNIFLFADGSCKTDGIYLPVTVHSAVNAGATVTNTTCGYNNGVITVTGATGGIAPYEYSLNGTTWQTSNVFSNLPSGTYTVYVRTSGNNCDYSFSATVGSSTAFTAGVSVNQDVCPGGSATISASGGTSYSWSNGATVIGTTASLSVTPSVTTAYLCTVTNGSGCQSLVSTTVTVDPLDDATFDFYDFCLGASNSAVNISTPGGTFSFNPAPGDGATINASTGEISNEVVGTTYSVQYSSNVVCANTHTETVLVNTVDDPQFTTSSYCAGGTNSVTGIATPGGTFTYNGTDASSINPSTGVITGGVSGTTYQITYTTPVGVCQSVSAPVSVTVNPTPTMTSVSNQSVCDGSSFAAINFSGTGGSTYNWSNTNSSIGVGASGSGNIGAFAATGTTIGGSDISGSFTVTPSIGTCAGTAQNFTLTVKALPDVQAGLDQTICTGQLVTLTATGSAASYAWDNSVLDGVAFTPAIGSVNYTVTGTGTNLCQNTDVVNVTVTDIDDPTFSTSNICEGYENIIADVVVSGGTFTYDGTDGSTIDPATGIISGGVLGTTYNIVYTTPAGACQNVSGPVSATVFANPTATGVVTNDNGSSNGAIDVTPAGGLAPYTFAWDHGPTTEDLSGLAAGTYGVNVTDANGCSFYLSFNVISTVGAEENPLNAALTIYPNPTTGALNVLLQGEFNVTVYDSRGRIIVQKTGNNLVALDLTNFDSAVYFVSIQQNESTIVKRIVKQ